MTPAVFIAAMLVISAASLMVWRGLLVPIVLLIASQLLGWVDLATLQISGKFDLNAAIVSVISFGALLGLFRRGAWSHTRFLVPVLLLTIVWGAAMLGPVLRNESTLWLALNASKEFMQLFAYFAVVASLRRQSEVDFAWRCVAALGAYYCVVEVIAQVLGPALLLRMPLAFHQDALGLWKIYLPYWPVILVFLFYGVFQFLLGRRGFVMFVLLGIAGLLLTFFRSYLMATIVVLPVVAMLQRGQLRTRLRSIELAAVLGVCIAVSALLIGSSWKDARDQFLLSGFSELRDQSGGSLAGRKAETNLLLQRAAERPMFGYGFLQRDSAAVRSMDLPSFAGAVLGFVDAGWADVVVKFGYGGGALLYLVFGWLALRALQIARQASGPAKARALTLAAIIGVFLLVQPVHAPLSYSFGLLPLGLLLGIVDAEQRLAVLQKTRRPSSQPPV